MQIAILAFGTRGDVQPYIALAKGLQEAGHSVRVVTHQNYEGLVTSYHLDFSPVIGNVQEIAESEEMRKLVEKGNFIRITMRTAKEAERAAIQWMRDSWAACQGAELLIAGLGGLNIAFALAEKMDVPLLQAYVIPFSPTSAFPGALFSGFPAWVGNSLNRISHHVTQQMLWQGFRLADKKMRKEILGLPPAPFWGPYNSERLCHASILHGFSPSVIAKPADWASNIHVTGYWFLDATEEWTPPVALTEFLQAGPPPVYIGFGSMGNRNPEETVDLVLQALQKSQQRAILLAGWGGLRKENLPAHVFMVDSIPHSWLFSKVAAVVHHGGAGTTAAGLRSGVPSIIIPFFGDQPFWGKRVADLGVGPQPIPRKQLTAEKLAQAIERTLTDQTMRWRAATLGAKIQAEDGVANAVALIEKLYP